MTTKGMPPGSDRTITTTSESWLWPYLHTNVLQKLVSPSGSTVSNTCGLEDSSRMGFRLRGRIKRAPPGTPVQKFANVFEQTLPAGRGSEKAAYRAATGRERCRSSKENVTLFAKLHTKATLGNRTIDRAAYQPPHTMENHINQLRS